MALILALEVETIPLVGSVSYKSALRCTLARQRSAADQSLSDDSTLPSRLPASWEHLNLWILLASP